MPRFGHLTSEMPRGILWDIKKKKAKNMTHYNLLKLKPGADAGAIFAQCEAVYAALEAELPFLHDAKVIRCCTTRDSNADILMIMQIDRPEQLGTYLQHPKHVALAQGMRDSIADRMSFDAE